MKIKAIQPVPSESSYCGLDYEDWLCLNHNMTIEVDEIPDVLSDYVKEVKEKPKKEKDE